MLIIKIKANENGSHENQNGSVMLEGYAVIPPEVGTMETLENFPFGDITVEEIDGVPTVTSWTPGEMPEPDPETEPETEPDVWAELDAAYMEGVNSAYDQ